MNTETKNTLHRGIAELPEFSGLERGEGTASKLHAAIHRLILRSGFAGKFNVRVSTTPKSGN